MHVNATSTYYCAGRVHRHPARHIPRNPGWILLTLSPGSGSSCGPCAHAANSVLQRLESRVSGGWAGSEPPVESVLSVSERGEGCARAYGSQGGILGSGVQMALAVAAKSKRGGCGGWLVAGGNQNSKGGRRRAPGQARAVLTGKTNAGPRGPSAFCLLTVYGNVREPEGDVVRSSGCCRPAHLRRRELLPLCPVENCSGG